MRSSRMNDTFQHQSDFIIIVESRSYPHKRIIPYYCTHKQSASSMLCRVFAHNYRHRALLFASRRLDSHFIITIVVGAFCGGGGGYRFYIYTHSLVTSIATTIILIMTLLLLLLLWFYYKMVISLILARPFSIHHHHRHHPITHCHYNEPNQALPNPKHK